MKKMVNFRCNEALLKEFKKDIGDESVSHSLESAMKEYIKKKRLSELDDLMNEYSQLNSAIFELIEKEKVLSPYKQIIEMLTKQTHCIVKLVAKWKHNA